MHSAALIAAALPALAMAAPAGNCPSTPPPTNGTGSGPSGFTLIAAHSASPVHLQSINANGGFLWIGKDTTTFCPQGAAGGSVDCSNYTSNTTAITCGDQTGAPTTCGLFTNVPAGQQLYVDSQLGDVRFTQAHNPSEPGTGSPIDTGFTYTPSTTEGQPGEFGFKFNRGSVGFIACADSAAAKSTGPWKLRVALPTANDDALCWGIDALAEAWSTPAWQYI